MTEVRLCNPVLRIYSPEMDADTAVSSRLTEKLRQTSNIMVGHARGEHMVLQVPHKHE